MARKATATPDDLLRRYVASDKLSTGMKIMVLKAALAELENEVRVC